MTTARALADRTVRRGERRPPSLQLEVYGEVMDALYVARQAGPAPGAHAWALQRAA